MDECIVAELLAVLEDIEVPALEVVHDLEDGGPITSIHIDYLA